MDSRLGEGSHHELRIHGVAGTPVEAMLDDLESTHPAADACGEPPPRTRLSVWRRRPEAAGLRAYSWGSVTSGSLRSVAYILLLPYVLANLAGWAALPGQGAGASSLAPDGPSRGLGVRLVTAGVRMLSVILTVMMAQWALLITVDLGAYQWALRTRQLPAWSLAVGVLLTLAVLELLMLVTRLRIRPDVRLEPHDPGLVDPVGHAWLTHEQARLWGSPRTIIHQRRAHHAVALGSVGVVGLAMIDRWVPMPATPSRLALVLSALAIVMGVTVLLQHSLSSGRDAEGLWPVVAVAARWIARAGVLALAVAAAGIDPQATAPMAGAALSPAAAEGLGPADLAVMSAAGAPVFLPIIRGVGLALTIGYSLLCLLVGLIAWQVRDRPSARRHPIRRMQAWNLPGLALLAGAIGGGMGAALAATVSRQLGSETALIVPGPLPEVLAISFAVLAVILGWVMLVGLARHIWGQAPDGSWRVTVTTAVQRLLRGGSWVSALLTALAITGLGLVILLVRAPENPLHVLEGTDPLPQTIVLAVAALVITAVSLAVAVAAPLAQRRVLGLVLAVGGFGAACIVVASVPGAELTRQLRPAGLTLGLLLPAGFMVGKALSAVRSETDRRTIAILWDVGTFLPRWFHPLSPPSYGDHVVTDLQALITDELRTDAQTLLLAPHSQGTVIAAVAILGLAEEVDTDRLALLTYGSPLRHLYAEFFPSLFDDVALETLHLRLGGNRWRNLLRTSDPIAAPIGIDDVDVALPLDPCGRGHSAYPREAAYRRQVADLQAALGVEIRLSETDDTIAGDSDLRT